MRVDRVPFRLIWAASGAALLVLSACGQKQQQAAPAGPVEVGVLTVRNEPVTIVTELPGRISPLLIAEVRARVDGIVLKRDFVEGSEVKAGQRLFQIDPAPYQAQLESARATLANAQANVGAQRAQADRYKTLVAANAISKQSYDNAVASLGQAEAQVASGRAAVRTASINLGYTNVTSPISGRIGMAQVTPGGYVQASAATLLATVQQIDRVYVDVTQSSTEVLRLRRALQAGQLQSAGNNRAKVELVLEDGSTYAQSGSLEFSDITVDQNTGSVTLRAVFPNPNRDLLPGMFVRARLQQAVNDRAMLVPQQGVTRDQKGNPTALVVGPDNKVALRTLETSGTRGNAWVVTGGLQPGDRVIVQGTQKAKPGATVKPVDAQMPALAASSPYASGPAAAQAGSAASAASAPSASQPQ
ncbi:efflux RND transporter periplasmic adaptor subunit [Chitinasiproducens palmae]|uniref:Membrane fusion protein, multidrug efflux system n=1 Tax=Chitinasiproducens palmae TaxID=1770053 RepID=A0A1H2PW92_9BURK|nr:efflux RND transporter periplasmic adaptor subunit [Chitinasiproducens palmae]SDV51614.1 membrane fusion protein, multidrug efflux system [Chitinasiproducens palmae]